MLELLVTEAYPDRLHEYKDWGKRLMGTRHHEAAISLQKESVAREMAFAVEIDNKPYIVHITEAHGEVLPADFSMPAL